MASALFPLRLALCRSRVGLNRIRPNSEASKVYYRAITNATMPGYVLDLTGVPEVDSKPGGWQPTCFHSSGEVKWTVIRLEPGNGEVPAHLHTGTWDYFMPLAGEAVIEVRQKDGKTKDYEMRPKSFLAVPPEDIHRVRNKSEKEKFVFLIAQAPRKKYDFIAK